MRETDRQTESLREEIEQEERERERESLDHRLLVCSVCSILCKQGLECYTCALIEVFRSESDLSQVLF